MIFRVQLKRCNSILYFGSTKREGQHGNKEQNKTNYGGTKTALRVCTYSLLRAGGSEQAPSWDVHPLNVSSFLKELHENTSHPKEAVSAVTTLIFFSLFKDSRVGPRYL